MAVARHERWRQRRAPQITAKAWGSMRHAIQFSSTLLMNVYQPMEKT
jgi:hypothetical protein